VRPVPAGVPGELYLAGPAVMRGYLGQPGPTAACLVPHPFGAPGAVLYRTGDLVRRRDEVIEYLGRRDSQLKVRGHRVDPAEVEAVLDAHPAVAASAVTARPDPTGQDRLIAYVVPADSAADVATADLRAHVAGVLPAALLPSVFVPVADLPRTPHGKLDRAALPEPATPAAPVRAGGTAPPASDLEQRIATIWQSVLGLDEVGLDDSFFQLGGTSLSITVVHAELADRLSIEVPMATLFQYPTIRALAGHLAGGAAGQAAPEANGRAAQRRDMLERLRSRSSGPTPTTGLEDSAQ
jgi:acyl carrier protein